MHGKNIKNKRKHFSAFLPIFPRFLFSILFEFLTQLSSQRPSLQRNSFDKHEPKDFLNNSSY